MRMIGGPREDLLNLSFSKMTVILVVLRHDVHRVTSRNRISLPGILLHCHVRWSRPFDIFLCPVTEMSLQRPTIVPMSTGKFGEW